MPTVYSNIDEIVAAKQQAGPHLVLRETEEYHGSKIETSVIGGRHWVDSSYRVLGEPDSGRAFRAVGCAPDGAVQYLSGGDKFDTVDDARKYIDSVIGD